MSDLETLLDRGTRAQVIAGLSYVGVLCFVPLMVRDNAFVHFHAKQGLVLWAWSVMAGMALFVPSIGRPFAMLSLIAIVMLSLMGLAAVALKKAYKLPLVYELANKI
ncbi:hypothetical protein [Magnetospira sp. QH-2]|uniref:hypothetical protein n=1 Tax=Magnetospira sp. (strain QH-2) TaxID=1288970 RepID=UPI0003E815F9|nr:hypothetical protein [Magnetospira sp. QH-2]CCQ74139.1 Conserved membrane protein of unknown function. Similar to amb0953 protein and MamF protein from Magnetospirillum magneticum (strain AMB-1 / ATCC 700264 [Magnetospira sp. QH-2]